jgi:hypothetical protein
MKEEPGQRQAQRSSTRSVVLITASVLLGVALGRWAVMPPEAVPASAPEADFSSARAREHLRWIARAPHAIGWPEHERVRGELVRQLEALGLEVHTREATVVERDPLPHAPVAMGRVRNVLARLPGQQPGAKALLLMAHYDSTPDALGTSDDGFGIAALLETARALKATPPPRQDILFLFTDGEEPGLLGARSFIEVDPLRDRVGLVLNFEARGNRGPVVAFQTSPGNGWLIEQLTHAPRPVASSLSQAVYALLPNDTDLSEFLAVGVPGLNFANIQGFGHYHSMTDTLEAADERTLQHHGSYALALARHFAELPLDQQPPSRDVIYFNAGPFLVRYPQSAALPLAVLTVCAFLGVLVRYRQAWSGKALVLGVAAQLGLVLAAAVPVLAVDMLLWSAFPGGTLIDTNTPTPSTLDALGKLAVALALPALLGSWLSRRYSALSLTVGALLVWLAATVALSIALPASGYLLQVPLLCAVASCAVGLHAQARPEATWPSWVLAALLVPPVMLVASVAGLLDAAANFPVPSAALAALLIGAFLPQLSPLLAAWRRLPAALAVAGALTLLAAGTVGRSDGDQRWPGRVYYALDSDKQAAHWLNPRPTADAWSQGFFQSASLQQARQFFPRWREDHMAGVAAPAAPLPPPELKLQGEQPGEGQRQLEFHLSAGGAPLVELYASPEARVVEAHLDGKRVPLTKSGALSVRYWALPSEGVRLVLKVEGRAALSLRLVAWHPGVPPLPASETPRWEGFRGSRNTLVARTVSF